VARLRPQPDQRHRLLWPVRRDHHPPWPAQRHLRQWRDPQRRRFMQLPRRSVQLWPRMRRRVSPLRRDRRHRSLQGHAPRSIVPRRRSDRP